MARTIIFLILLAGCRCAFAFQDTIGIQSQPVEPDTLCDTAVEITVMSVDSFILATGPALAVQDRTPSEPGGWFFLLNCLLLSVIVMKFMVFRNFARKSWNAWINENLFFQFIREKAPVSAVIVLVESIVRIYLAAVFVLFLIEVIAPGHRITSAELFRVCGYFVLFFLAKSLVTVSLAWLTDQTELFRIMNLSGIIFTTNAGYFLLPMVLTVAYLSVSVRNYGIYVVLAAFGLGVILLIFRALRIFLKLRLRLNLQFFLYLCGLEILPFLFLAKILETNVFH